MLDILRIKETLTTPLNPKVINNNHTRLAAVMIIICGKTPTVIMTERPITMNHHGGEISFPGGTWKDEDVDLLDTALRETREELDVEITNSDVIGQLRPVTTLNSGFKITPFVAILDSIPKMNPNSEIESILTIPLVSLLDTIRNDTNPNHQSIQEMYVFTFKDYIIWGASARMIKQIRSKLLDIE